MKKEDAWIHYECRSKGISPSKKAELDANCSNCNQPFEDNEEKVMTWCTIAYVVNFVFRHLNCFGDLRSAFITINALRLM